MSSKKVVIVGAGPGGLTAGMILANKGYQVDLFEKQQTVGGRNARLSLDGYHFDLGPTFLMMKFILEEVFELAGRKAEDYLDIRSIDPLYRLDFGEDRVFFPTHDKFRLEEQIERLFPGNYRAYQRFMKYEKVKFKRLVPCLQVPYDSLGAFARTRLIKALPYLDAHLSLYKHLSRFFTDEDLKIAFTFQAKYLGMSPWSCPATFSIISYIEHAGGIHHPIGGLNRISQAMAKVIEEEGGRIHLGQPVQEVLVENGRAQGVLLESGDRVKADHTIINADFGHAMSHLIDRKHLRKWHPDRLAKKEFSCSTFMLYLGLDKLYKDVPHHNILFASDYRKNVREIAETMVLSEEPSIYIQNASITDPTLAPEGHSTLYILVPCPNNRSRIDWEANQAPFREKVLEIAEKRGGLADLKKHITVERIITPTDWEQKTGVHIGATFNLAHSFNQMLYFRPHNQFEEIGDCYLVGGGTHPGSGLPTIYESGRISAGLILKRDAWYLY
ncbi:MAG: phytoene desaturase [Bradymonadales bacterium]|nr:phytoene desaturase [Bradymonadales bacterium]